MLEAVVFDFDGVIVDSPTYYFKHMREFLKKLNKQVSDEHISDLVGLTFSEKLSFINRTYGLNVKLEEFVSATSGAMKIEMASSISLDSSLQKFMEELDKNSIPMAIASNNNRKTIEYFLDILGISNRFKLIVCADDGMNPKPAPDAYLRAVKMLGKNRVKCVAIEDTIVGVRAAKLAGLIFVAMPNKFSTAHDFSEADLITKGFGEISLKVLEGLLK